MTVVFSATDPLHLSQVQMAALLSGEAGAIQGVLGAHMAEILVADLEPEQLIETMTRSATRQPLLEAAFRVLEATDGFRRDAKAVELARAVSEGSPVWSRSAPLNATIERVPDLGWRVRIFATPTLVDEASFNILVRDVFGGHALQDVAMDAEVRTALAGQAAGGGSVRMVRARPQIARQGPAQSGHLRTRETIHSSLSSRHWNDLKGGFARLGLDNSAGLFALYAQVVARWSNADQFDLLHIDERRERLALGGQDLVGQFSLRRWVTVAMQGAQLEERVRETAYRLKQAEAFTQTPVFDMEDAPVVFKFGADQPDAELRRGLKVLRVEMAGEGLVELRVHQMAGELHMRWSAMAGAVLATSLDDLAKAFERLLILATHQACWSDPSPELIAPEQLAVIAANNDSFANFGSGRLHDGFLASARRRPAAIALIGEGRAFTYADVESRTRHVARALAQAGVGHGDAVGIAMPKTWAQVVAVLAILRAGGVYVPLDGSASNRFHAMAAAAGIKAILTAPGAVEGLEWPVPRIDASLAGPNEPPDAADPGDDRVPDDPAYVIFTSGSTGAPKGVVITHAGARNTCCDINQRFSVGGADRILAISDLSFDLSVYDIFGVLAAGGTIIVPPHGSQRDPVQLYQQLVDHQATVWNSAPAILELLVTWMEGAGVRLPPCLRLVLLSGDWIPLSLPDRLRALADGGRVVIAAMGGATEASIWSNLHVVERILPEWRSIPYGRPLANQQMVVLDRWLNHCPFGVPGEIHIGGVGLAVGYLGDPERTADKFIRHPRDGRRWYRTGDDGRYLPNGEIEFLGRRDGQVKIGGHRIELGEIEAALIEGEAVRGAVVITIKVSGAPRLHAYLLAEEGRPRRDLEVLRADLRLRVPRYMEPDTIEWLDAFPVTSNGKVDRAALSRRADSVRQVKGAQPVTAAEVQLAELWRRVLVLEDIGLDESFFERGGDSLRVVQLHRGIHEASGLDLPLKLLFENVTIRQQAKLVARLDDA